MINSLDPWTYLVGISVVTCSITEIDTRGSWGNFHIGLWSFPLLYLFPTSQMVASEMPPNFLANIKKNTTFHGNRGIPGGTLVKNLPANASDARDASSNPGSGRPHGVGNGDPLQYSCLGNSMGSQRVRHNWAHTQEQHREWKRLVSEFKR